MPKNPSTNTLITINTKSPEPNMKEKLLMTREKDTENSLSKTILLKETLLKIYLKDTELKLDTELSIPETLKTVFITEKENLLSPMELHLLVLLKTINKKKEN